MCFLARIRFCNTDKGNIEKKDLSMHVGVCHLSLNKAYCGPKLFCLNNQLAKLERAVLDKLLVPELQSMRVNLHVRVYTSKRRPKVDELTKEKLFLFSFSFFNN